MSSPKNFHNAVDVEKLGINEIPKIKTDLDALETRVDNLPVLPGVTSADAGKVLKVNNNGEWSPSADAVIIKCSYDTSTHVLTLLNGMKVRDVIDIALANNEVYLNTTASNKPESGTFWKMTSKVKGFTSHYDNATFSRVSTEWYTSPTKYNIEEVTFNADSQGATTVNAEFISFSTNSFLPTLTGEETNKLLGTNQYGDSWVFVPQTDGLPEVTSSDNGKLLEVVNGAWSKSNDISDKVQFIYDYLNLSGEELVHSYDFTVDGDDLITTDPVNLTSESATTFSAGGLQVSANDHMQLRGLGAVCGFNRRLVFELGVNNITGAGNLLSVYNGNSIKWTGTEWTINGNSTGITNPNYFYNKVLQIKIGASYNDVKIMTQDGVIYEGSFNPAGDFGGLMIGGFTPNGGSCYTFYVKTLKVYASF